jgi:hypothetical protein
MAAVIDALASAMTAACIAVFAHREISRCRAIAKAAITTAERPMSTRQYNPLYKTSLASARWMLLTLSCGPWAAGKELLPTAPQSKVAETATAPKQPESIPPGASVADRLPAASDASGESSRYRYENGRWWYYTRSNEWLVWNGSAWERAVPSSSGSGQRSTPQGRLFVRSQPIPSPGYRGWVGGFYSSGGGYGASDFGYGYGVPTYGPSDPRLR